jgi:hypothetical protein
VYTRKWEINHRGGFPHRQGPSRVGEFFFYSRLRSRDIALVSLRTVLAPPTLFDRGRTCTGAGTGKNWTESLGGTRGDDISASGDLNAITTGELGCKLGLS